MEGFGKVRSSLDGCVAQSSSQAHFVSFTLCSVLPIRRIDCLYLAIRIRLPPLPVR